MDGRFAISMHILTLLTQAGSEWLSSEFIASSININPVLVRKEISNLSKQGLVISKEGKNGGTLLAKPPEQIQLSDVFRAVQRQPLLGVSKNTPNPACPVGRQINQHLATLYEEAEAALARQLGTSTLADFCHKFN